MRRVLSNLFPEPSNGPRSAQDRMAAMGYSCQVFADCSVSGKPVEVFSVEQQRKNFVIAGMDVTEQAREALGVETTQWLPFFAEAYNISPKLDDYVVVPVVIMPSDLPNRNCVAFPYSELTKANVDVGQLAYQTWRAKPTFTDHVNKDHSKAKGIIFSSVMRPMKTVHGDLWKIVCLAGYDRTRDPDLVNSILTGERNSYSMGAWTTHFTCSVCSAVHRSPKQPGCHHVQIGMSQFTVGHPDNKLGYLDARTPVGFELSSVTVPAYYSATTEANSAIQMW